MRPMKAGRLYVAYPDSRGDHQHQLASVELGTGRELWRQRIAGEVITAPVLAEGHVYLATLEGSLCCFRQDNGAPVWQEAKNATSAPIVWKGRCYFSQRREVPTERAN